MAVVLCILAFALLLCLWARRMPGWRLAFFAASATWGTLVWLVTELLSRFHAFAYNWLLTAWSLICLVLAAAFSWLRAWRVLSTKASSRLGKLAHTELAIVLAIGLILGVTALNAILAPPNTDDAMEYHLPRVVLWSSNQSVSFFPTSDVAQLIHSPWSEYAILHFYVLSKSDRLSNFIEWFSFLGCILGASLTAQLLGGSRLSQFLAALLVATLPEAILESSGCDNTAVGAFWIVAAVVLLLEGGAAPDLWHILLAGASLGLAVLAKGTSAVFIPPILLALLFILRPARSPAFAARLLVLILAAVAVNTPQALRNISLTGHALGLPYPEAGTRLRFQSDSLAPSAVFSGVVRNAAVHLSVPSSKVNTLTEKSLRKLIRLSGANPDDPRTTWRDLFTVPSFTTREYFAGNLGQFVLILGVALWALIKVRPILIPPLWLLAGCTVAFACFSAALKWNPSASRYHLPLFVLACSSVAVLMPRILSQRIVLAVAVLAFLASLLYIADNGLRSFLPMDRTSVFRNSREQLYFIDDYRQDEFPHYLAAARELQHSSCKEIGLDMMFQSYAYPMMALVHQSDPAIRFQYTGVENATSRFSVNFRKPTPCAVVCLGCMRVSGKWQKYRWLERATVIAGDNVVFWPGGETPNPPETESIAEAPSRLALRIEQSNSRLASLPEFGALSARHDLDSPFQDQRGAILRAKRDAVYELRMRAEYLLEWSEPMRRRAMLGAATSQDVYILQMADQALLQLIDLVHLRYADFVRLSG